MTNKRKPHTIAVFLAMLLALLGAGAGERPLQAQPAPSVLQPPSVAMLAQEAGAQTFLQANCRYGVSTGSQKAFVLDQIGAGVFYKFDTPYWNSPPSELVQNNAELVRMIGTKQKKTADGKYLPGYVTTVPLDADLAQLIRSNPGTLWLIGNEIERGPDPGKIETTQGDMFPDEYAKAYHDIYKFIKGNDPTARVAIGGVIQPTPMRLQYLDMVWEAYQAFYGREMPVDVWNVHVYPLAEVKSDGKSPNNVANVALGTDPTLGRREAKSAAECGLTEVYCLAEHDELSLTIDHVRAMRQWMKEKGQQQKPLVISEYGIVFAGWVGEDGVCYPSDEYGNCFDSERVANFLSKSLAYFSSASDPELGYALDKDRLVQQVIWFSAFHKTGAFRSNLLLGNDRLSPTGKAFRDFVATEPTPVNLVAERAGNQGEIAADGQGGYKASIFVDFRNNGDVTIESPFRVTFYEDEQLSRVIGKTVVAGMVRGCATSTYRASIDWEGLQPGRNEFWVKLDSRNDIEETPAGDRDNVLSAVVEVDPGTEYYSLEILVNDEEGGTVSIDPNLSDYPAGTTVSLEALPFAGWAFSHWSGNISGEEPNDTVLMNRDKSVTAHFTRVSYALSVRVKGEGSVLIDPQKEAYAPSERVRLVAIPAPGWRFYAWVGDVTAYDVQLELAMEEDIALRARFIEIQPEVSGRAHLPVQIAP